MTVNAADHPMAQWREDRRQRQELLDTMDQRELVLRQAIWSDLCRHGGEPIPTAELTRPLVITPFDGNYGLAGHMVCINGSPPRGAYAVMGTDRADMIVYSCFGARMKKPLTGWGASGRSDALRHALVDYVLWIQERDETVRYDIQAETRRQMMELAKEAAGEGPVDPATIL